MVGWKEAPGRGLSFDTNMLRFRPNGLRVIAVSVFGCAFDGICGDGIFQRRKIACRSGFWVRELLTVGEIVDRGPIYLLVQTDSSFVGKVGRDLRKLRGQNCRFVHWQGARTLLIFGDLHGADVELQLGESVAPVVDCILAQTASILVERLRSYGRLKIAGRAAMAD